MRKINILILFLFTKVLFSQQTPASKQSQIISIEGATAHIGNGKIIENALIVFENGKLIFVGNNHDHQKKGKLINAKGKHIYPGFIAPNSTLGLAEVDAIKASLDYDEVGAMNPHIRSIIAYNSESKIVETMRPNGVLLAQIVPRGGRISGTSSIVQLDAWNWEDALISENDGIHLNWPKNFVSGRWWLGESPALKENEKYNKEVSELSNYFSQSKAYNATKSKKRHLPFEALNNLISGTRILYIHVNHEKGIIDAINFVKNNDVKKMVIVGGYEAINIIDLLTEHKIPVLLKRIHSTPKSDDEAYDFPFVLAANLVKGNVLVGLQTSGDMERASTRNLPFYAGTCAAYGLNKEEALKLITLNNAKILGIESQCGSLEVGKDATLFISEGDALDMRTNKISKAYIQGRDISLESHQTMLYNRYSKKYGQK